MCAVFWVSAEAFIHSALWAYQVIGLALVLFRGVVLSVEREGQVLAVLGRLFSLFLDVKSSFFGHAGLFGLLLMVLGLWV